MGNFLSSFFATNDYAKSTRRGRKNVLLIIDPQIDFHVGGSLAVPGAEEDSKRTAKFIIDNMSSIDDIYVTMDSHHVWIT